MPILGEIRAISGQFSVITLIGRQITYIYACWPEYMRSNRISKRSFGANIRQNRVVRVKMGGFVMHVMIQIHFN